MAITKILAWRYLFGASNGACFEAQCSLVFSKSIVLLAQKPASYYPKIPIWAFWGLGFCRIYSSQITSSHLAYEAL